VHLVAFFFCFDHAFQPIQICIDLHSRRAGVGVLVVPIAGAVAAFASSAGGVSLKSVGVSLTGGGSLSEGAVAGRLVFLRPFTTGTGMDSGPGSDVFRRGSSGAEILRSRSRSSHLSHAASNCFRSGVTV
jgi:hypothetical protein